MQTAVQVLFAFHVGSSLNGWWWSSPDVSLHTSSPSDDRILPWFIFIFSSPSLWPGCECAASGRLCNLGCATCHYSLFMLLSFTNQVLAQHDLMWYWKETAAYKTDAYILPKLLGEKVATLPLAPPCARFCARRPHTGAHCSLFLELPPEFYGQFDVILRASRLQIWCQLQFFFSSTS